MGLTRGNLIETWFKNRDESRIKVRHILWEARCFLTGFRLTFCRIVASSSGTVRLNLGGGKVDLRWFWGSRSKTENMFFKNANHVDSRQKLQRGLTALDGRRRWDSSYEQRSLLNKVAQFNLCGGRCTAAIDSVMKPLSFNSRLLYIHRERRAAQPLWRHANTLIFFNTAFTQLDADFDKQNKCPASTNRRRSGGAALMAEPQFHFLYPLFNAGAHVLPVRVLLN